MACGKDEMDVAMDIECRLNYNTTFENAVDVATHLWNSTESQPQPGVFLSHFELFVYLLNKYAMPVLIFGGLIGNALCLTVFLGSHLRLLNCYLYLAFLNATDSLFLLCLLTSWLSWWEVHLFHDNGWCQLIIYASYVSSFCSIWTVVIITGERFLVVFFPMKRHTLCTRCKAFITLLLLALVPMVSYSFALVTNGVIHHPMYGKVCMTYPQYDYFSRIVTAIDTFVTLLCPALVVIACNAAIAFRIRHVFFSVQLPKANSSLNSSSSSQCLRELSNSTGQRKRIQLQTTKSLLVVSSAFLLLNLPYHMLRIHLLLHFLVHTDTPVTDHLQRAQHVLQFCSHLNHAINFLLYCACSRSFNRAFRRMKTRWRCSLVRRWTSLKSMVAMRPTTESSRP